MNLILDIGNTRSKTAVFDQGCVIHKHSSEGLPLIKDLSEIIHQFKPEKAMMSSVRKLDDPFISLLGEKTALNIFNSSMNVPVKILYKTRESLGKDRIAGIVGASIKFPGENILVIDMGSAITYDFLNSKGEYPGGNISPGMKMRFRALHEYTDLLPYLNYEEEFPFPGEDTRSAILGGVIHGISLEINGFITQLEKNHQHLKIILTGGDSKLFDKKIKKTIFVEENLILEGLNAILEYQQKITE